MEERFAKAFANRIAEFEVVELPSPTPRSAALASVPGKADAVVGMRRVGKSWLLLHRIHELLATGVPRDRILYCEFEDERLAGLTAEHLGLVEEAFFARYPDSRDEECWFFFDEIQEVPGWEKFVRRLLANQKRRLTVTGSSASLLSREIATSLRGRALTTELLPFSFAEALTHHGLALPTRLPVAGAQRSKLEHAFGRYLTVGGFPEVQHFTPDIWRRTLQSYQEIAVLRDVAERHAISNLPALRFVVRRLLRSTASKTSAHAMHQDLRSQGIALGKDRVYELFAHLEDAFLVFFLPLRDDSERRRQMNPRKVYAIDHGLVRACVPAAARDVGHHLENLVYLELRRRGTVLGYHLTKAGHEVDFVFERRNGERELIQACADLEDPSTLEREVRALREAVGETGIEKATLVTLQGDRRITSDGVEIRVAPAWQWLLERE